MYEVYKQTSCDHIVKSYLAVILKLINNLTDLCLPGYSLPKAFQDHFVSNVYLKCSIYLPVKLSESCGVQVFTNLPRKA